MSVDNFAILAVVDPIWIVTAPSGMEAYESQVKRYGVTHPYPLPSLWRSSPGWLRNFPGLIMASRLLWDFCKIPQKLSFFVIFGLATTIVTCATQPHIGALFLNFWRF